MTTCPRCAAPAHDDLGFCAHCGAPLRQATVAHPPPLPPPPPLFADEVAGAVTGPQEEPPTLASYLLTPSAVPDGPRSEGERAARSDRRSIQVLVVAVAALVLGVGAGLGLAVLGDDDPTSETSASTRPSSGSASSDVADEPSTEPTTESTTESGLPPVARLAAGLSCLELRERGYDFAAADRYWSAQGRPGAMDADANGIPCETRFDTSEIRAVYGSRMDTAETDVAALPSGLRCDLLRQYGVDRAAMLAYWAHEGRPGRLDPDGDGSPCDDAYAAEAVAD